MQNNIISLKKNHSVSYLTIYFAILNVRCHFSSAHTGCQQIYLVGENQQMWPCCVWKCKYHSESDNMKSIIKAEGC